MCYCPYSACFTSVNVLFQPLMHMMLFSMCLTVLCEPVSYKLLPVMNVLMSFVCLLPCATVLPQRVLYVWLSSLNLCAIHYSPSWDCVRCITVLFQAGFDVILFFLSFVFLTQLDWEAWEEGRHTQFYASGNTPLAVSCVLCPLWWGDSVVVTCVVS